MNLPAFGLGTFRLEGQVVVDAVTAALEFGYRLIDTAQFYSNEAEIGRALAASSVPRRDIFITTKVWPDNFSRFVPSVKESLSKLGIDTADLLLIHWPAPSSGMPLAETLGALLDCKNQGLASQVGVSNFNIAQMQEAVALAGLGNIATNQVELSPYFQNLKVATAAKSQGIRITSYMTLARGTILEDPVLLDIAGRHGATVAQVALAWAMQLGYTVIPSSTQRSNLQGNLLATQLRLSDDEMARIAALDRDQRMINPPALAPEWD
ncbi:MAG: 2,5-didehydrogluconate reductase DkgB [Polaromonas sp.]|jgi:2,5-diketo-D-gluconate reductase B|nr:2,5-didehydrogluconate reductase DkgB [Polaromonas sp.]